MMTIGPPTETEQGTSFFIVHAKFRIAAGLINQSYVAGQDAKQVVTIGGLVCPSSWML